MHEGKVDDTTVDESIEESGITLSPKILESGDSGTVVVKDARNAKTSLHPRKGY